MFWKKPKNQSTEVVAPQESSWWPSKKETKKIDREQYPQQSEVEALYLDAYSQVRSIVPKGSVFQGSFSYQVPVRVEGILQGDLISSSDVVLAPGSQILGRVECEGFYNFGEVQGQVSASRTIIYPKAKVLAELKCENLTFANGAVFEGKCQMNNQG